MNKNYKFVRCEESEFGLTLFLDDKLAVTPLGNPLILPTIKLADAIAAEWRAQGSKINKETMPLTGIACIAIDYARDQRESLCQEMLAYGETDLLCYRTGNIPELQHIQQTALDPLLVWAKEQFGVELAVTEGLMPVKQPLANRQKLAGVLAEYDEWKLAALAACLKPLGSLMLSLALIEGRLKAEQVFTLAHLEEDYETRKWGRDAEKDTKLLRVKHEILAVGIYRDLIQ